MTVGIEIVGIFNRIADGMEEDKRAAIGIRAMPFFVSVCLCVDCRLFVFGRAPRN